MKVTRAQLRRARRAASIDNWKAAGLEAEEVERFRDDAMARELGLEIESGLPRRLEVGRACAPRSPYEQEFNHHLFIAKDEPWTSPEQKLAAYLEAARCYNAVAEALEYAETTDMPSAYHRADELLRILREGGRP